MKSERKSLAHLVRNAKLRQERTALTTKKCSKCKKTKDILMFNRLSGTLDGRQYWCKECAQKKRLDWYHNRGGKTLETKRQRKTYVQHRAKVREGMWKRKLRLVQLAGGKCADCSLTPGQDWPLNCFEFHHIGEKTVVSMQRLIRSDKSMPLAIEEISRCVLLCANCHKRRHVSEYHPIL